MALPDLGSRDAEYRVPTNLVAKRKTRSYQHELWKTHDPKKRANARRECATLCSAKIPGGTMVHGKVICRMSEPLQNPPLIEAVCEFQFGADCKWDWTIPGRLFEKVGNEFSDRTEVHRLSVKTEQVSGKSVAPSVIETGPERIQLKRPDGSAMIQVGPKQLIINVLRPYPRWETFRDLIVRIYETYMTIVEVGTLGRLGLRYINQIEVSGTDYRTVVTVWPSLARSLERGVTAFVQRYELRHDKPEGLLVHQTGLMQVEDKSIVMLDLDFISSSVAHIVSRDDVLNWLEEAHCRVEEAFIDSLTPEKYRELKEGRT